MFKTKQMFNKKNKLFFCWEIFPKAVKIKIQKQKKPAYAVISSLEIARKIEIEKNVRLLQLIH